jgi:hypothetical protein
MDFWQTITASTFGASISIICNYLYNFRKDSIPIFQSVLNNINEIMCIVDNMDVTILDTNNGKLRSMHMMYITELEKELKYVIPEYVFLADRSILQQIKDFIYNTRQILDNYEAIYSYDIRCNIEFDVLEEFKAEDSVQQLHAYIKNIPISKQYSGDYIRPYLANDGNTAGYGVPIIMNKSERDCIVLAFKHNILELSNIYIILKTQLNSKLTLNLLVILKTKCINFYKLFELYFKY